MAISCRNYQIRTNSFVCAVRRFAVGDVCERRLWRMKRAKRSGRIKAIGKQALPAQTEPLIQQEGACPRPALCHCEERSDVAIYCVLRCPHRAYTAASACPTVMTSVRIVNDPSMRNRKLISVHAAASASKTPQV